MQKRRFGNHTVLTFIVIFSLLIGVLVLAQTTAQTPNPGHSANQILVDVTGTQQDLQQAFAGLESRIATLEAGGGGSTTQPPNTLTPGNCAQLADITGPPSIDFVFPVPQECRGGNLCTLLLEQYDTYQTTDLLSVLKTTYYENAQATPVGDFVWTSGEAGSLHRHGHPGTSGQVPPSSYNFAANTGKNGDTSEAIIISSLDGRANLKDDETQVEIDPDQWTFSLSMPGWSVSGHYVLKVCA